MLLFWLPVLGILGLFGFVPLKRLIDILRPGTENVPPMPLKHFTETLLVLILGVVLIVTGILTGMLPALPAGLIPWGVLTVLALAYPIGLYALLRRHRADYWFRLLHFAPLAIVLVWMALQLLAMRMTSVGRFTMPVVITIVVLFIVLLIIFCLHVIRRREQRVGALAVLAVLFLAVAIHGQLTGWQSQMGAMIAQATPRLGQSSGSPNLEPSSNPAEEEWRKKLRDASASSKASVSPASMSSAKLIAKQDVTITKKPKRLPQSGPVTEMIAGFMIAGYCGVVHARAKKRMQS